MKEYGKNIEILDRLNCTYLEGFMSREEEIGCRKMIALLHKYNELIKTFNISIAGETSALDDIKNLRNERDTLTITECQFTKRLKEKEENIKGELKKIQNGISHVDIHDLKGMNCLSTTMIGLEEKAKKVVYEGKILENLRGEEDVMLQKHNSLFTTFCLYENRLQDVQFEIKEVIQEMEKQVFYLESLEEQKEETREMFLETVFTNIPKSTMRMFSCICSEVRSNLVQKYLDLIYSYGELKQSIMKQCLPIAQSVIENYKTRPVKLERNTAVALFSYNIETQLYIITKSIYQIILFSSEKQKLEAQRLIYNMELIRKQNILYRYIIQGEDVEENVRALNELSSKESGSQSLTQLYKEVSSRQNFSFYTFASKKYGHLQIDGKASTYKKTNK